jgi:hypothetical protein
LTNSAEGEGTSGERDDSALFERRERMVLGLEGDKTLEWGKIP